VASPLSTLHRMYQAYNTHMASLEHRKHHGDRHHHWHPDSDTPSADTGLVGSAAGVAKTTSSPAVITQLPDNDYYYMSKNDVTVICSTTDMPQVLDSTFSFATTMCLIYAENIAINGNLQIPGKSLGLFCSKLTLGKPTISIDVSGSNGKFTGPETATDGDPGDPGKASGSIWVFVESPTNEVFQGLKLSANGGDGGKGGDTTAPGKTGGQGGAGGNAGMFSKLCHGLY
jgi:hypothetical protein